MREHINLGGVPLPAPTKQTHHAEFDGEERESGWERRIVVDVCANNVALVVDAVFLAEMAVVARRTVEGRVDAAAVQRRRSSAPPGLLGPDDQALVVDAKGFVAPFCQSDR